MNVFVKKGHNQVKLKKRMLYFSVPLSRPRVLLKGGPHLQVITLKIKEFTLTTFSYYISKALLNGPLYCWRQLTAVFSLLHFSRCTAVRYDDCQQWWKDLFLQTGRRTADASQHRLRGPKEVKLDCLAHGCWRSLSLQIAYLIFINCLV